MKQFLTKRQCEDLKSVGFKPSGINIAGKYNEENTKYVLNPFCLKSELYDWYPTFTIGEMFEIMHELQDDNNFTYLISFESNRYRISINGNSCDSAELIDVLYEAFIELSRLL
jgi:hypothetical protein